MTWPNPKPWPWPYSYLGGLGRCLLGSTPLELTPLLPWIEENRAALHAMNAEATGRWQDAALAKTNAAGGKAAPEPQMQAQPTTGGLQTEEAAYGELSAPIAALTS